MTDQRRTWFDGTINVPTILTVVGAAITAGAFGVGVYNSLDHRVSALEYSDKQQEQHFTRVENDQAQIRSDVKEQLRDIASDVKDAKTQISQVHDQLLENSPAARPELQRWTKK